MTTGAKPNASIPSYPNTEQDSNGKYTKKKFTRLVDKNERGKDRNWQGNKQTTEKLNETLNYLGFKRKAERVDKCGVALRFRECSTAPARHPKKLVDGDFCRDRMCPQCQWRKSMRQFSVAVKVGHEALRRYPGVHFLFLTLTVPNVSLADLGDTLDLIFHGWKKLYERKEVKKCVLGYHRALEISYNAKENTFHPHIHAALMVPPDYFESMHRSKLIQKRGKDGQLEVYKTPNKKKGIKKGDVKLIDNPEYYYIKRDDWLKMWQESMNMPQITQVDIRKIRGRDKEDEIKSGFAEACKYSLKYWSTSLTKEEKQALRRRVKKEGIDFGMPGHIWLRKTLEETAEVVKDMYIALHGRRLVQWGGELRNIKRELKLQDAEEGGDLVNTSDEKTSCACSVCGAETIEHLYVWFSDIRDYIG